MQTFKRVLFSNTSEVEWQLFYFRVKRKGAASIVFTGLSRLMKFIQLKVKLSFYRPTPVGKECCSSEKEMSGEVYQTAFFV